MKTKYLKCDECGENYPPAIMWQNPEGVKKCAWCYVLELEAVRDDLIDKLAAALTFINVTAKKVDDDPTK